MFNKINIKNTPVNLLFMSFVFSYSFHPNIKIASILIRAQQLIERRHFFNTPILTGKLFFNFPRHTRVFFKEIIKKAQNTCHDKNTKKKCFKKILHNNNNNKIILYDKPYKTNAYELINSICCDC